MTTDRLCDATLAQLPADVARPTYDRGAVRTGIVHLGVGAFHRAHQAAYTDAVLAAGDARWSITAASLRSPDTRNALAPQDGLYALNTRGETDGLAVIGSIGRVLAAPEEPAALLDALCAPTVAIVSLTVTEKAYCRDPASGTLDEAHPDILHDLLHPHAPRSALGWLAAAIARRRAEGLPAFTVLCCDNLPANGRTLHRLLARFIQLRSPGLGAFVENEVSCPDTTVDRIVPATAAEDRTRVDAALGLRDAWPVIAEPFSQWVVADRFPAGRPAWEDAGVTLVADVAPFEAMKLRMLNASHSALAYLGLLAGVDTVAEAMRDPGLAGFAARVMDDAVPTLAVPPGTDLAGYKRALLARFRNPALRHRLRQIAADGSQKLPQRVLDTMRDRLALSLPVDAQALVVAAWGCCGAGGEKAEDPAASVLEWARTARPPADRLAPALFGLRPVFGALGEDPRVQVAVTTALCRLNSLGARRAVLP